MRVLIDTHIFLWIFLEPQRIPIEAERFLQNTSENEIFISHASAWEIAIKFGTGKLKIPETPDIFVPDRVRRAGYLFLPIELRHVSNVYNLPPIHKPPTLTDASRCSANLAYFLDNSNAR